MADHSKPRRRRKVDLSKPQNLVLEEILSSLLQEKQHDGESTKGECKRLQVCLQALKRYPLPIVRDDHLKLIQGFNTEIIELISQRKREFEQPERQDFNDGTLTEEGGQGTSDHALALRLQEQEIKNGSETNKNSVTRKDVNRRAVASSSSQEEEDHRLAMKLHEEEVQAATKSYCHQERIVNAKIDFGNLDLQCSNDQLLAQRLQAIYDGDRKSDDPTACLSSWSRTTTSTGASVSLQKPNEGCDESEDEFDKFLNAPSSVFQEGNRIIAQHSSQSQVNGPTSSSTYSQDEERQGLHRLSVSDHDDNEAASSPTKPLSSVLSGAIPSSDDDEVDGERKQGEEPQKPQRSKLTNIGSKGLRSSSSTPSEQVPQGDNELSDHKRYCSKTSLRRSISLSTQNLKTSGSVHCLSTSDSDDVAPLSQSASEPKSKRLRKASNKTTGKDKASTKRRCKKDKVVYFDGDCQLPSWCTSNDAESSVANTDRSDQSSNLVMDAGSYEVVLIVDSSEVSGGSFGGKKQSNSKSKTIKLLDKQEVPYETRNLHVGDFVFIARPRNSSPFLKSDEASCELVLPYIIERKRLDDLDKSFKDDRYKEQKLRLKTCGIRNKIYLIERHTKHRSIWDKKKIFQLGLEQAIVSTACSPNFVVQQTEDLEETVSFLSTMTRLLRDKFAFKQLRSASKEDLENSTIDFETHLLQFSLFNSSARKHSALNCRQILCHMLTMQSGVTWNLAWSITEKYPTLGRLIRAFRDNNLNEDVDKERRIDTMLCDIVYEGRKHVSKNISKVICAQCTRHELT